MAITDYRPVGDYVLLEKVERIKTPLVLLTPDTRTMYTLATIRGIGPKVPTDFGIAVGDVVWVRSTTGEQYEDGGVKYWWVSVARNDLLGVKCAR